MIWSICFEIIFIITFTLVTTIFLIKEFSRKTSDLFCIKVTN